MKMLKRSGPITEPVEHHKKLSEDSISSSAAASSVDLLGLKPYC